MTSPDKASAEEMQKLLEDLEHFVNGRCLETEKLKVRSDIENDTESPLNGPDATKEKQLAIEGQAAFNCLWKMPRLIQNLPHLLAYIRTLEKEHRAMRDTLAHVENFGYGDYEITMIKQLLSSLTLNDPS